MVNWRIQDLGFANCNCDYGCPCQFNALPTHGNCEAAAGYKINNGYFGDVNLNSFSNSSACSLDAIIKRQGCSL